MIRYLELYRDYLLVNEGNSIKTVESYINDIKQYFQISKKDGMEGYLKLIGSNMYTRTTQNRKISALRSYYNYLMKYNYHDNNPFLNVVFAKKEKKLPEYLSYPEILKIMAYYENDLLNKALIEVLYGCGLRVSELIGLKISDIHYDEGLIEVYGKGRKKRYIPINKKALMAINEYKIKFRDRLEKKDDNNVLFLNKRGHVLYREYINTILNNASKELGFNKKVYPHMIRHSFSTHMLENGANLRAIQELLGHENIATTQIYTHVNKRKLVEDYNKYFNEE